MNLLINATQLQASLSDVVERVSNGARYTVIYWNRPAFQIVPLDQCGRPPVDLANEPLYRAQAVGRSTDGRTAAEHGTVLYRS
jgi:antitoxin (DNA-binding transcriptional repressor) of toxin-antitoxin stability system